ncbi:MAG: glycoside hydrolase family 28 protein, partial [Clostridia bacterium]|nr:glycoside hydrolase family 28 protein [Clostridia bacterium]
MNNSTFLNVTDYGIIGDGVTNNTQKIKALIDEADKNGGGTIYFPPGKYLTGSIVLKSNMTLYLDSGAHILGSADPADYPMITKETLKGYNREGHTGLVAALNAENVTVTGRGILDGQGQNWWPNPKNEHRPRAIQFINCTDVLI